MGDLYEEGRKAYLEGVLRGQRESHPPPNPSVLLAVVVVSLVLGALAGWCCHAWTEPVHTIPPAQAGPKTDFWMDAYGNDLPPPGGWIVPHEGSLVR